MPLCWAFLRDVVHKHEKRSKIIKRMECCCCCYWYEKENKQTILCKSNNELISMWNASDQHEIIINYNRYVINNGKWQFVKCSVICGRSKRDNRRKKSSQTDWIRSWANKWIRGGGERGGGSRHIMNKSQNWWYKCMYKYSCTAINCQNRISNEVLVISLCCYTSFHLPGHSFDRAWNFHSNQILVSTLLFLRVLCFRHIIFNVFASIYNKWAKNNVALHFK